MIEDYQNAFLRAVEDGYMDIVNTFLNHRELVDASSALFIAVSRGNIKMATRLLDSGVPVGWMNDSAVCKSVEDGNIEMTTLLLDHGADVNAVKTRFHILTLAAIGGNVEMVKLLLERGTNTTNVVDAAFNAAYKGKTKVVEFLHERGFDIDADNSLGVSIYNGDYKTAKFIITNVKIISLERALKTATAYDERAILELLRARSE